jgi:hypothetical protein
MKVYVAMTDMEISDRADKIFLHKIDAEKYVEGSDYHWIEEHEVIE